MDQRTCAWCSGRLPADSSPSRETCSPQCKSRRKEARKTERYRTDPEYRASVLKRQTRRNRAAGVRPLMDPTPQTCPECSATFTGAYTKRYCAERCRRKAEKRRGRHRDTGRRETVLMALVEGKGVHPVRVTILPNGGAWIYCPRCKGTTHVRWQADRWFERHCLTCDVHLTMNEEELRWVTSETASTAA